MIRCSGQDKVDFVVNGSSGGWLDSLALAGAGVARRSANLVTAVTTASKSVGGRVPAGPRAVQ